MGDWEFSPVLAIPDSLHFYGDNLTLSQSVHPLNYRRSDSDLDHRGLAKQEVTGPRQY